MKAKNTMLEAAIEYRRRGFSVIPIRPGDKRPLIKWEEFQHRRPDIPEIEGWFKRWPDANVAIVTGKISGVCVVDIDDMDKGQDAISRYIPETIVCPCVTTPGGMHLYFRDAGLGNNTRGLDGCDLRGEGGYVVAPPSINGGGKRYAWVDGLGLGDVTLPELPEPYRMLITALGSFDGARVVEKGPDGQRLTNDGQMMNNDGQMMNNDGRGPQGGDGQRWTEMDTQNDRVPQKGTKVPQKGTGVPQKGSAMQHEKSGQNTVTAGNHSSFPQKQDEPSVRDSSIYISFNNTSVNKENEEEEMVRIPEGVRDDTLYRAAYDFARIGKPIHEARELIAKMAALCDPPFPIDEAMVKVESAYRQAEKRGRKPTGEYPLLDEVRDWVLNGPEENITASGVAKLFYEPSMTQAERRAFYQMVHKTLTRMAEDGLIDKTAKGFSQKATKNKITVVGAHATPLDLKYPLGIEALVRTFPRSIIMVAGTSNAGKTTFAMDFAHLNLEKYSGRTIYVTSEMGAAQMAYRLNAWRPVEEWDQHMTIYEGNKSFYSYVEPDGLTIIDFMEIYDEFWAVGREIQMIHDRLNTGIALVCIQKKRGARYGRGAEFGLEKPQLYLSMDYNRVTIEKAKAWATTTNPNGMECEFDITGGCKFVKRFDWRYQEETKKVESKKFRGTFNPE